MSSKVEVNEASRHFQADYDWDCDAADTQYLTHNIHRYSGKFIPQVARNAIDWLTRPGDMVLDPYCGSGTTLLECALMRRRSIGADLNPLATLIAEVKTTPIDPGPLQMFTDQLTNLLIAGRRETGGQVSLFDADLHRQRDMILRRVAADARRHDPWFVKWFTGNILEELLTIYHAIQLCNVPELRRLATVAFSDILRRSSNAHKGYPNVMYDKNHGCPPPAIPRFLRRLKEVSDMVRQLWNRWDKRHQPTVITADAQSLDIQDEAADAIITHPPYIGSVPYAEYGMLSLRWLGFDERQIDALLTGGRRQSKDVLSRFETGFRGMLREARRTLKSGRPMFMLLGRPTVRAAVVDLPQMAVQLASQERFELRYRGQRRGINRRANKMGVEEYLVFVAR